MKLKLGDKITLKRKHEKGEIESHPYGEKKKGYLWVKFSYVTTWILERDVLVSNSAEDKQC